MYLPRRRLLKNHSNLCGRKFFAGGACGEFMCQLPMRALFGERKTVEQIYYNLSRERTGLLSKSCFRSNKTQLTIQWSLELCRVKNPYVRSIGLKAS